VARFRHYQDTRQPDCLRGKPATHVGRLLRVTALRQVLTLLHNMEQLAAIMLLATQYSVQQIAAAFTGGQRAYQLWPTRVQLDEA